MVAANTAEILLLGWRWSISWIKEVTKAGTVLGSSGRSERLEKKPPGLEPRSDQSRPRSKLQMSASLELNLSY